MRAGRVLLWIATIALLSAADELAPIPATPRKPVTDTYNGVAVVDDYRWLEASADPEVQATTVAGMFVGTPAYMAPERLLDEPYDGRADVYAVGVMMYEMLSGRLPFQVGDAGYWSLAKMHIVEPPPSLTATDPGVPRDLEAIVTHSLAWEKKLQREPWI